MNHHTRRAVLPLAALALVLAAPAPATETKAATKAATATTIDAAATFERLKGLEGTWRSERPDGQVATSVYTVTAGGNALQESYSRQGRDDYDMLTVYYLEGDRLVLTHYCAAGNRPTMVATLDGAAGDTIAFALDGQRGLADPAEGHMHRAVFELQSADRMTQHWTFVQDGRESFTEVETYHRVRE